jgi:hypothetical protein
MFRIIAEVMALAIGGQRPVSHTNRKTTVRFAG